MDEGVMLIWVDSIVAPYAMQAPEYIVPILFLDSYRLPYDGFGCEKNSGVGVEVEHIPGD
jgi:hypothetical protein